jgi:hypothetical protein
MTGGKNRPDGSESRADPESSPPSSGLAGRGEGRQKRSNRGDAVSTESNEADDSTAPTTDEKSEFFFPAASAPDDATHSTGSLPGVTDDTDTTSADRADDPEDGFGPDAKTEAIIELVGDARNLLVMGPLHTPAEYDLCTNLLVPDEDAPEQLLLVTFDESPDERLNVFRGQLGSLPDTVGILNVGDATRSGSPDIVSTTGTDGIRVRNVRDATDVQRMGLTTNKYLSEWEEGETVLCFHSLTALLRAVDSESVFRFLNVLLGRVRSGDICAHYHVDPDAHDEQTLETYRPLFDETIRYREDGSVEIDR